MVLGLMRVPVLLMLTFAACVGPGEVAFTQSEGAGAGLGACDCSYDDGSHGDKSLQFTCTHGNATFGAVSFFLDPTKVGESQGMSIIFQPSQPGSYAGGGTGKLTSFGKARRAEPGKPKIIHDIEGVEVRWTAQDACDVTGCANSFHLEAGALSGGTGSCQDFWATIDQY